jgi:hypothetical protein
MAKQKQTDEIIPQTRDLELESYQNSLKKKINMLGSCFSIILILLGLFLLVSGLFGIVDRKGIDEKVAEISTDNNEVVSENENKTFDSVIKETEKIEQGENQGEIGEGLSTYRVKAETSTAISKAMDTQNQIAKTHRWRATDYEKGDIGIGEYEVKQGDTLWEIAEAVYGSGFLWTKILDSNHSNIGFLPDGTQALIFPGQILVINKL